MGTTVTDALGFTQAVCAGVARILSGSAHRRGKVIGPRDQMRAALAAPHRYLAVERFFGPDSRMND